MSENIAIDILITLNYSTVLLIASAGHLTWSRGLNEGRAVVRISFNMHASPGRISTRTHRHMFVDEKQQNKETPLKIL